MYNVKYSLENIPTPSREVYCKRLMEKIIDIKRMRWKAFFFDNSDDERSEAEKITYGTRSKKCTPTIKDPKPFEEELLQILIKVK